MRNILSWVGTVLFAVAFGLSLLVFDVIMRITFLIGRRPSAWVMGALQSVLIADMRLAGIRVEVERSPRIQPRTSYIIVSNHQSMFDIPNSCEPANLNSRHQAITSFTFAFRK